VHTIDDAEDEPITAINVTPLVDISLVLLIVLMTTAACIASKSIPMDTAQSEPTATAPIITITLDAEGRLFIDGAPAAWSELEARARNLSRAHRDAQAIIAAHPSVRHGVFVRVIDELRSGGITHYGVQTPPPIND
jgi:biopolymer transport protein ExbD